MKTLYIECNMGAAGDMLCAALISLFPDRQKVLNDLNSFGIPGVTYSLNEADKCGIKGLSLRVLINGEEETEDSPLKEAHAHAHPGDDPHSGHPHHHGRHLKDIDDIIRSLKLPDEVKADISGVYSLIAEAESEVHGKKVSEIHLHEVGALDAIADISAACYLIRLLSPDCIVSSPVNLGSGTVKCAHGILPVPAPAVSLLIKGIPAFSDGTNGELLTPTGAALIKHFSGSFGGFPEMTLTGTGIGMGKKDFSRPNCVRVFMGTDGFNDNDLRDRVYELSCSVDDMTGEETGFAASALFDAGALDVSTFSLSMKKGRPGTEIRVLCRESDRERFEKLLFKHTSTLGIRESLVERCVLNRKEEMTASPYGDIRVKKSSGYGVTREKPEYDDIARIAGEKDLSFREVLHKFSY